MKAFKNALKIIDDIERDSKSGLGVHETVLALLRSRLDEANKATHNESVDVSISNVEKAIGELSVVQEVARLDQEVQPEVIESVIDLLSEAIRPKERARKGPVVTMNEGIIVCVTWQDEEGRILEVLAESENYPDMRARESQALEAIENLIGAFDNPIVCRKVSSELTEEAIKRGRAYIERHKHEGEDDGGLKIV